MGGGAQMLRVLVVGMELAEPIFSGNGVYGRSLVDGLLRRDAAVLVVCAGPSDAPRPPRLPDALGAHGGLHGVVQVALPSWGRLDRHSAWEAWVERAALHAAPSVRAFKPNAVLAIDWTAVETWRGLQRAAALAQAPPLAFACLRVFAASDGAEPTDRAFHAQREASALGSASLSIAISSVDRRLLRALDEARRVEGAAGADEGRAAARPRARIAVLTPPLRAEIAAIANRTAAEPRACAAEAAAARPPARTLVLYCGRIAAEKNVRTFTRALALAAAPLRALGVRPALVGSGVDASLVADARAELRAAFPDALIEEFASAERLAALLRETVLFVHPARYESFGMALVEAAALGAPLLLDGGGDVGAADLLPLGTHAFTADMSAAEALGARLVELLPQLLQPPPRSAAPLDNEPAAPPEGAERLLHPVAHAARATALGRGMDAFAADLHALLAEMIDAEPTVSVTDEVDEVNAPSVDRR